MFLMSHTTGINVISYNEVFHYYDKEELKMLRLFWLRCLQGADSICTRLSIHHIATGVQATLPTITISIVSLLTNAKRNGKIE